MSQTQLNSVINRVVLKTVNASLQNFQLMNSLTTIVDSDAKISDLLLADNQSDTQTLLSSTKTIMDFAVARGLASIDASSDSGSDLVFFNYIQQYSNSPSSTTSMKIFSISLGNFYKYNASATNDYTNKTNTELYNNGVITNADYISELSSVIFEMQQCISLITDILSVA